MNHMQYLTTDRGGFSRQNIDRKPGQFSDIKIQVLED